MKYPIVILHGWGSTVSGQRYKELKHIFEKNGYRVFTPDLPGFGTNILKKSELVFEDYVMFVKKYVESVLQKTKRKKIILLGHSFGGRVAIKVARLYPQYVAKLILTGSSGIPRPLPSLKKKVVFYSTKILRPIFIIPPFSFVYALLRKLIYYSIGEMDYYKSGPLSQTFKNVYRVNIADDLEKIKTKTLLVWGENDTIIPVADGMLMNKCIPHSTLQVIKNATHKLPYENPREFAKHVVAFLN